MAEKRLIDLDAYEDFKTECLMSSTPGLHLFDAGFEEGMERAAEWLDALPTVYAVEVVRCKDCKHWFPEQEERCKALNTEPFGWCCRMRNVHEISYREITKHKDFCSFGERRTDNA